MAFTKHDVGEVVAIERDGVLQAFFGLVEIFQVHPTHSFIARNFLQNCTKHLKQSVTCKLA